MELGDETYDNIARRYQAEWGRDWTLTPRQKIFLLESTRDLLKRHDPAWFQVNQETLRAELSIIFKEI